MHDQDKPVFGDAELFKWIYEENIAYACDENNLITILPDAKGNRPPLIIPDRYKIVELSRLKEAGTVHARGAESADLRSLQKAHGLIDLDMAITADLSSLEFVKICLNVPCLEELVSPVQYVGLHLYADSAKRVDLNHLRHVEDALVIQEAKEAKLDALEYVGHDLFAPKLKKLHAPHLETVYEILTLSATEGIYAPRIKYIGGLEGSQTAQEYLLRLVAEENKRQIVKQSRELPEPDDMVRIVSSLKPGSIPPRP